MAKIYGELEKAQAENTTSDAATQPAGMLTYRTDENKLAVSDGTTYKKIVNEDLLAGGTEYDEIVTPAVPAATKHKLYFKADGKAYTLDNAGSELPIGSGSGGSKNYIPDNSSNIESNVGDWLSDDGVGGASGLISLAPTSVVGEVLVDTASLLFTKTAANASGHFFKIASKTIDPGDYGGILHGNFYFKPHTGYVSSDLILEVYDVTNAAVLYSGVAADLELLNLEGKVNYKTYLEATTAQVELRLKVNNVNTNAYTVSGDVFTMGPDTLVPGAIAGEATRYTKTDAQAIGNAANVVIGYDVMGYDDSGLVTGTGTGWLYTSKINGKVDVNASLLMTSYSGWVNGEEFRISVWKNDIQYATGKRDDAMGGGTLYASSILAATVDVEVGDTLTIKAYHVSGATTLNTHVDPNLNYVSINEHTRSGAMLSTTEASFSTVVAQASTAATTITGSTPIIVNGTTDHDDTGSYNSSTGEFTAPLAGDYKISCAIRFNSQLYAAGDTQEMYVYVDAVLRKIIARNTVDAAVTTAIFLNGETRMIDVPKGGVITVRAYNSVNVALDGGAATNHVSFERLPDFSTFSVYGEFRQQGAIAGPATPGNSAFYTEVTGGSLTLEPGTHRLPACLVYFGNSGANPAYSFVLGAWYSAPGTNSTTRPAILSAAPGLSVLSATEPNDAGMSFTAIGGGSNHGLVTTEMLVKVTQATTVYLVPYAIMTTPGAAQITVYPNAEKIQ